MNTVRTFNSKVRLTNLIIKKYNSKRLLTINSRLQPHGKGQEDVVEGYVPIYKFPYIRMIATVNKIKINHIIASAVVVPSSLGLHFLEIVGSEAVITAGVLAFSGAVGLSLFSFVTNNWIGFVYLNNDNTKMKISYVDFWGKRKDTEIPIDDITPLSEIRPMPLDTLFQSLRRYSTNEQFKFNRSVGVILDKDKFSKVFGEL